MYYVLKSYSKTSGKMKLDKFDLFDLMLRWLKRLLKMKFFFTEDLGVKYKNEFLSIFIFSLVWI